MRMIKNPFLKMGALALAAVVCGALAWRPRKNRWRLPPLWNIPLWTRCAMAYWRP